ncbi:uncharacterized protein LOC100375750 isoform X2 [Saccoglossus kowalevskii]
MDRSWRKSDGKKNKSSPGLCDFDDYNVGGISSCIEKKNSHRKMKPEKKVKLSQLFGQPSQFSTAQMVSPLRQLTTQEDRNPHHEMIDDKQDKNSKTKKKTMKVEQTKKIEHFNAKKIHSEILFKREEGLRNADQDVPQKKKKKRNLDESDDPNIQFKKRKKEKLPANPEIEKRTVFIGNLPVDISKKELTKLFKKYGDIESVRLRSAAPSTLALPKKVVMIKEDFHPDRKNLNAYVVYKEEISALKSLKKNGKVVRGHHIRVDVSSNASKHDHQRSVFIGNLPYKIDEEIVRQHFMQCGNVISVRLVRDGKTGIGKGFGYVLFKDISSVEFALKFNDKPLFGRKVRIKRSFEKEKNKPGNITGGKRSTQQSNKITGVKLRLLQAEQRKSGKIIGGKHRIQQTDQSNQRHEQQTDQSNQRHEQQTGRKPVYKGAKAKQRKPKKTKKKLKRQ